MKMLVNNKYNDKELYTKNWKGKSKKYILELEKLLDKIEGVDNQELKKEILIQVLKCDNELTLFSEKLFKKFYKQGYRDAKKIIKIC